MRSPQLATIEVSALFLCSTPMQQNDNNQKQGPLSWSTPSTSSTPKKEAPASPSVPPIAMTGSNTGKYVGMVVVGIIAGVLIAWGWSAVRNPSVAGQSATSTEQGTEQASTQTDSSGTSVSTSTGAPAQGADSAFTITSPQPAGTSVAIAKAIVDRPTWIVVYENKNGTPGNALGATLFFPAAQQGKVELLRATVAGKSYLAVKQVDDGDRKFELRGDQYLSEGGEVQWVTFEVR